ncbi:hypothetical protein [Streptomyces sp. NPDC097619]|uniref:hypothetical protein n=1 Tax=Streptomyces sp. NPDC097619 TaxID=3157228 RepID=UPI00331AA766
MLTVRLALGTRPLAQLRRLLVAAASAGTGFLFLHTLVQAVVRPAGSAPRLLWCLLPLAATAQFAAAVARTDPPWRTRDGLSALGLGPVRLTVAAALSTAVACALGSAVALLVFLHLRGDLGGLPFDGAAATALHADADFPVPAALTLLALAPLAGAAAAVLAVRPHPERAPQQQLPWGVALLAAGLAVLAHSGTATAGLLAGGTLTAAGLALAGPALSYGAGALVQMLRPGALRLLAGRALQQEAARLGPPLGIACAVAAAALTVTALPDGPPVPLGGLTAPAAALVAACAAATVLTTAAGVRRSRTPHRSLLLDLGAPGTLLRSAAGLQFGALLLLCAPLSWALARLGTLALTG